VSGAAASTGGAHSASDAEPRLEITYCTDPLCCWSWGLEPQLRRLRYANAGRLAWRLRMGGMIPNWVEFSDPVNAVHRPMQMGPLWLQAKYETGMPIDPKVWWSDPPDSSWPACIAVKAAALQSAMAGELYLRDIREAVMLQGRNIARLEVLGDVARESAARQPNLIDASRLIREMEGAEARSAFKEDVKEARFWRIGRFPALLVRNGNRSKGIVGWRPYAVLRAELQALAPDLGHERSMPDADAYRRYWCGATDREIAEADPDRAPA